MYAKIDGSTVEKYPYTFRNLQTDNPNVSFPHPLPADIKADYNVADVNENAKPDFDPLTENIIETAMTVVDGVAQINYAKEAASTADQKIRVRDHRNSMIERSDYMALSDVTMSDEWTTYRQALRDVPQQEGFPANVTWPDQPDQTE